MIADNTLYRHYQTPFRGLKKSVIHLNPYILYVLSFAKPNNTRSEYIEKDISTISYDNTAIFL